MRVVLEGIEEGSNVHRGAWKWGIVIVFFSWGRVCMGGIVPLSVGVG